MKGFEKVEQAAQQVSCGARGAEMNQLFPNAARSVRTAGREGDGHGRAEQSWSAEPPAGII